MMSLSYARMRHTVLNFELQRLGLGGVANKSVKMKLIILDDYDQASEWAAKYVRNKIKKSKPGPDNYFVLGLPTGEEQHGWRVG